MQKNQKLLKKILTLYRSYLSSFYLLRIIRKISLDSYCLLYKIWCQIFRHPLSGKYYWRTLSDANISSVFRIKILEPENLQIEAPKFFGFASHKALVRTPSRQILTPRIEVIEFRDASVVGGVDFVFKFNDVLHSDLFIPSEHYCPAENIGVISRRRNEFAIDLNLTKPCIYLRDAVSMVGQCSWNYAHWLTEILPKLTIIDNINEFQSFPIIIDSDLHSNIIDSIKLINRYKRQVIQISKWSPIFVQNLIAVSSPGYERYVPHTISSSEPTEYINTFSRSALLELRRVVIENNSEDRVEKSGNKIYLARDSYSANMRQICNLEIVEQTIFSRGIQKLRPEIMSFQDQVKACMRAELIIGPIGATLANMIFAPVGCKIIALSPFYDEASYHYYTNLAGVLGHNINFVLGKQVSNFRHPMHRDYVIDTDHLIAALD